MRRWKPLLGACVWERRDGLRFHTGGVITLAGEEAQSWRPSGPTPEVKRHRVWIHAADRAFPEGACWPTGPVSDSRAGCSWWTLEIGTGALCLIGLKGAR